MKNKIAQLIQDALSHLENDGFFADSISPDIQIERTKDKSHGDLASNIAMTLAKAARKPPRAIAEAIVANLAEDDNVTQVTIAGPGFINFFVSDESSQAVIDTVLAQGVEYGRNDTGRGQKAQVEFVSANPTGPLHVGHGRGAAYGASVANLLEACGYQVEREYYVNDAGRQMDILAASVWLRYLQACGQQLTFPSNGYQGEYVKTLGQQLQQEHGDSFLQSAEQVFAQVCADAPDGGDKEKHIDELINKAKDLLGPAQYRIVFDLGLNAIIADIREDLIEFGIDFQTWFSERSLTEDLDLVDEAINTLNANGFIEERDGALWFKSTEFGDDKDRVVKRENGQTTYFASDIAYHLNKFQRGFDLVVNVWGADHHGYIARVKAALQAMKLDPEKLQVRLVQLVTLYRGEEQVQMSTRSGSFVTLRSLRDEVGTDAARFFYVTRKAEQATDFDLELAKSQSKDNPVYYIQYAHARVCSVQRKFAEEGIVWQQENALTHINLLNNDHEKALLEKLSAYPEIIRNAGLNQEPHALVNYLRDLAGDFHAYYNAHKMLNDDTNLSLARLTLSLAVRQVLANGLALIGVSQPESM